MMSFLRNWYDAVPTGLVSFRFYGTGMMSFLRNWYDAVPTGLV